MYILERQRVNAYSFCTDFICLSNQSIQAIRLQVLLSGKLASLGLNAFPMLTAIN